MLCRSRNRLLMAASVVATGLVSAAIPAFAVPATAPAAAPATRAALPGDNGSVVALRVVVAAVQGMVQVRDAADQPWRKAEVGMEVGENAEFRTGPRSSVTCQIPPDQTFVIDRLGVMRVAEAVRSGDRTRTELIMKYGRTQYSIEAAGAQHESTIRSPSSTLAVRGTVVSLYDQPPFTPEARSFTGRAVFGTAKREIALGARGRGARVLAGSGSAAETALNESVVDPRFAAARTNSEAQFIATEQSQGGVVNFDRRLGINTIKNSPPFTDEQLAQSLPGRLNFVLRWYNDADLDLTMFNEVGDPLELLGRPDRDNVESIFQPQDTLYPGFGLNTTSTGGQILFNHQGGPSGGQEIAFWGQNAPNGLYGLSVFHVDGERVRFTLDAILDGQPLTISANQLDENGNPVFVTDPVTGELILDEFGQPQIVVDFLPRIERVLPPDKFTSALILVPDPFSQVPPTPEEVQRRSLRVMGPNAGPVERVRAAFSSGPPINAAHAQQMRVQAKADAKAARESLARWRADQRQQARAAAREAKAAGGKAARRAK